MAAYRDLTSPDRRGRNVAGQREMAVVTKWQRRARLAFYLCLAGGAAVAHACAGSKQDPKPEPDPDAGAADASSSTDAGTDAAEDAGIPDAAAPDADVIVVDAGPEDADLWDVICE